MTTQFSQPLWESIRPLQYLQFPWRFLTFTTLFSSFLAGSAVAAVYAFSKSRITAVFSALLLLIILFYPNLKLFRPQTYLDVNDSYYTSDEFLKWKISKTSFEFVPKGVKTVQELSKAEGTKITQLAITPDQIATQPFSVISGIGEIKTERNVPGNLKLQTKSNEPISIQLNTFDFPGWEVRIDGKKTLYRSDNDLRLISVDVPLGKHTLEARFRNTPIRTLANLLTLVTGTVLAATVKNLLERKPRQ